jgi:hypothetical protein
MAAFNWFQRSYEEEPEKPKEEEETSEAEKEAEAPASPEDYLKWAKAAYQNIQAKAKQRMRVNRQRRWSMNLSMNLPMSQPVSQQIHHKHL